jgi:ribosomal protein L13
LIFNHFNYFKFVISLLSKAYETELLYKRIINRGTLNTERKGANQLMRKVRGMLPKEDTPGKTKNEKEI